jgi:hypothetical protein
MCLVLLKVTIVEVRLALGKDLKRVLESID